MSNVQEMFTSFRLKKLTRTDSGSTSKEPYIFVLYFKIDDDTLWYAYNNLPEGIEFDDEDESALYLLGQTRQGYVPKVSDWLYTPNCQQNDISAEDNYLSGNYDYVYLPSSVGRYTPTLKTRVIIGVAPDDVRIGCFAALLDENTSGVEESAAKYQNEFVPAARKSILDSVYQGIHGSPCIVVPEGSTSLKFQLRTAKVTQTVTATVEALYEVDPKHQLRQKVVLKILPSGASPYELERVYPLTTYPGFSLYTYQALEETIDSTPLTGAVAGCYGGQTLTGVLYLAEPAPAHGALVGLSTDHPEVILVDYEKTETDIAKEIESNIKGQSTDDFLGSLAKFASVSALVKAYSGSFKWAPPVSESGSYVLDYAYGGWADLVSFDETDIFYIGDAIESATLLTYIATPVAYTGTESSDKSVHHAFYPGSDGHIHHLWCDSKSWHHADLTQPFLTSSNPTALDADRYKDISLITLPGMLPRIHFRSNLADESDDTFYIREFSMGADRKWSQKLLSPASIGLSTSIPSVTGKPCGIAYGTDGSYRIIYISKGAKAYPQELYFNAATGKWTYTDMMPGYTGGICGDPCGYALDKKVFVFCRDTNSGHILEWFKNDTKAWQFANDLSTYLKITNPAISEPFCFVRPTDGMQIIVFRMDNFNVRIIKRTATGTWVTLDLTTVAVNKDTGATSSSELKAGSNPRGFVGAAPDYLLHISFRNKSGYVYDLSSADGKTWKFVNTKQTNVTGNPAMWTASDNTEHYLYFDKTNRLWHVGKELSSTYTGQPVNVFSSAAP